MLNEITAIVGKDWVRSDETKSRFAVDQQQPALVIEPGSAEELCEVLKIAHGARRAIVPVGSGTGLWLGNPTEHIDMAVSTRRLNAILEYEPADLTVSVQAGCTLQHLNDTLAQHNQWLPLDPPRPNLATLGAVAAMNEWGPLRLGFGLARDHTIGIVVALAEGTLVKSGGRVVKNVAGYDLIKVFLGSLGTLGVISGLNFKLRARPETDTTCQVSHGDANSVSDFVKAVAGSGLLPVAMEWFEAPAARCVGLQSPRNHRVVLSRFMDTEATVRFQVRRLLELAWSHQLEAHELPSPVANSAWDSIRDLTPFSGMNLAVHVNALPADTIQAIRDLQHALGDLAQPAITAQCRLGLVRAFAHVDPGGDGCDKLARRLSSLRLERREKGWSVVIRKAPRRLKARLDVWGDPGPAGALMKALKQQLDPHRILNPGRFVAGI